MHSIRFSVVVKCSPSMFLDFWYIRALAGIVTVTWLSLSVNITVVGSTGTSWAFSTKYVKNAHKNILHTYIHIAM